MPIMGLNLVTRTLFLCLCNSYKQKPEIIRSQIQSLLSWVWNPAHLPALWAIDKWTWRNRQCVIAGMFGHMVYILIFCPFTTHRFSVMDWGEMSWLWWCLFNHNNKNSIKIRPLAVPVHAKITLYFPVRISPVNPDQICWISTKSAKRNLLCFSPLLRMSTI